MREKIIDTSIRLFDEKGYMGTSVQDIVDSLGVTKGTFYYYYKSKQQLLTNIHLDYIEHLIRQQEIILNDPCKEHHSKLYDMVYMIIRNIRLNKRSARIFFREMRHLSEGHLKEIKRKRNIFRANVQSLIEDGIENGEFKDHLRPDILTFGILGMTNWSYYWFNPEGEVTEEELARTFVDIVLKGAIVQSE
ncbi:TetR/AcrR family transcriptional regulator [Bacillus ginsengihumi]|uniref:TetR family transcriptional regulator n=2 Tax=Heyndrickxia ginsengihumi TaxID=363870 RepID=A0A0A6VEZ2_9BACI|nr:TetR/AcrR family transcriptional regulator [Heyndrickxia ginsengihumi]KHD86151.1 TetR family transcriptional regulator [Heyndrickxia ginsengihumi]MBE6184756.1 TetR/AcrR family transcriptional regulator [Bacillus sp. (in: firmicutes)]MCM3023386.1 TetR/AcrR family transcriptional regulator [Heyndrickxia ginsengihumi]NEY21323.1 TetR/AcrR family transcriptional regulator [Heyndrickxia ginsengihumi]